MRTRRTFSPAFKAKVILECISGEKSVSEITRAYQLSPILVSKWRTEFMENSAAIFERNNAGSEDQHRIADLERLVGRLTLENEMLKKASSISNAPVSRSGK